MINLIVSQILVEHLRGELPSLVALDLSDSMSTLALAFHLLPVILESQEHLCAIFQQKYCNVSRIVIDKHDEVSRAFKTLH